MEVYDGVRVLHGDMDPQGGAGLWFMWYSSVLGV